MQLRYLKKNVEISSIMNLCFCASSLPKNSLAIIPKVVNQPVSEQHFYKTNIYQQLSSVKFLTLYKSVGAGYLMVS